MAYTLTVNGRQRQVSVESDTPLLWVLRDELGLTGTKYGCGIAQCGACTVHMNGSPTKSCSIPISAADGAEVTTIEGLDGPVAQAVQDAWVAIDVPQCGYCQSGQVMRAVALLQETPKPSDTDVDQAMGENICRCATYVRIRRAIHDAAEKLAG